MGQRLSAEQIRANVRQPAEAAITRRADAAASVGELAQEWDAAQAVLAEVSGRLGAVTAAALEEMTLAELASFTGRTQPELDQWSTAVTEGRRGRRRNGARLAAAPSSAPVPTEVDQLWRHPYVADSPARTPTGAALGEGAAAAQ